MFEITKIVDDRQEPTKVVDYFGNEYSVSEWVNWMATDSDGAVWGYEHKPRSIDYGSWISYSGRSYEFGCVEFNGDFTDSLVKV